MQFSCIYTSKRNLAQIPQGSCFVVLSTEMFLWPFLRSPQTPSGQWPNICLALLQRYPQWLYIFLSQADWCLRVSSLLLVLSLYIFIIKSTSISSPLCDTFSSVLRCNLRPSTDSQHLFPLVYQNTATFCLLTVAKKNELYTWKWPENSFLHSV